MMDWNEIHYQLSKRRKKKERKVIERNVERENPGNEENQARLLVIPQPPTYSNMSTKTGKDWNEIRKERRGGTNSITHSAGACQ